MLLREEISNAWLSREGMLSLIFSKYERMSFKSYVNWSGEELMLRQNGPIILNLHIQKRTELSTIWARDLEYSFQVFVDNDALSSKLNINEEQCELLGAGLPSM